MGTSSASTPTPPNVGTQLGEALGAVGSGNLSQGIGNIASATGYVPGAGDQGLSGFVANQNTQMNIGNVSQLANAYFGSGFNGSGTGGNLGGAQTEATNLANSFLGNENQQVRQYEGKLTADQLNANPYTSMTSNAANNVLGMGNNAVTSGMSGLNTVAGMGNQVFGEGGKVNPGFTSLSNGLLPGASGINPGFTSLYGNLSNGATGGLSNQLQNTAASQLALGGNISQQEQDMVTQASRAADSQRGIFDSNASASNELLNLDQYSQQRLMQREQLASSAVQTGDTNALAASNILNTGMNNQLNFATGASNILNTGLGMQLAQQEGGAGILQNASSARLNAGTTMQGAGLQQLSALMNTGMIGSSNSLNMIANSYGQGSTLGANLFGGGLNTMMSSAANPTPTLFNSLGLFNQAAQNQQTTYNAQFTANQENAQAQNQMTGSLIGAGAAVGSAVIGGVAIF